MKKALSSIALGLLLIGCECTDTCQNVDANASATPGIAGFTPDSTPVKKKPKIFKRQRVI